MRRRSWVGAAAVAVAMAMPAAGDVIFEPEPGPSTPSAPAASDDAAPAADPAKVARADIAVPSDEPDSKLTIALVAIGVVAVIGLALMSRSSKKTD